ncbi:DNA-(apurinic or apyrimidinic site) lyase [Longilinea arvoryzae]|uniref:DNA-(Apurinic or apyrimidinic site) lyase n=1 Tax=Longilinea arvoryzae TaxID=360412 RepID=A0A0S7BLR8_9CHLR|nr:bifunctional DNA-formamidopyrimidine glycosylase/DNA-(apurinic or apyrimidinic site) lyase [Longilinea arvoryzae]GAP15619.1 DNA-(apurinic or apyrimidinic site) lyase [Longilinea arvoryzae]
MPELPEVETIVRALRDGGRGGPSIVGQVVQSVDLLWSRTLAEPLPAEFEARLPGQQVVNVERRGKFVILRLSRDFLLIHLRMSGDLRVEPGGALQPHDRLILNFTDGLRLVFNDARKFGRAWLTPDPDTIVGGLGPEPFDPALSGDEFYRRLAQRRRQIKTLLLDQTFLAGVGNIYSDEALHLARIHPLQNSAHISREQAERLLQALREVLTQGIRTNGASIDWVYRGGEFQNTFRVYGRKGLPCPVCGTPIARLVVGQRSTHFCPKCQVLAGAETISGRD